VKTVDGGETRFRLTASTRCWVGRKPAGIAVLKPGDAVVVRYRLNAKAPAPAYDVADAASWDWLDRIRHDIVTITIGSIASRVLCGSEGSDPVEIEYRFSPKTVWRRLGQAADASAFHVGDRVSVVPRMLPSGAVMAALVADTAAEASTSRALARASIRGTLVAVDEAKHIVQLRAGDGHVYELPLASGCVARRSGEAVPLAGLREGTPITIWLRRGLSAVPEVSRIAVRVGRALRGVGAEPAPLAKRRPAVALPAGRHAE